MNRNPICDICGKECFVQNKQELYKAGTWGTTEEIDTCLDCTKKLSKFAQKLKGGELR